MIRNSRSPNESRSDELESLSDIDELALDKYLLTAKERNYKTKIWEALNGEYLEEQAFKGAAARQKSQYPEKIVKEKKRKHSQNADKSNDKEDMQKDAKRKRVESNNSFDIDKFDLLENLNEENNQELEAYQAQDGGPYTEHDDYFHDNLGENHLQNGEFDFEFDF